MNTTTGKTPPTCIPGGMQLYILVLNLFSDLFYGVTPINKCEKVCPLYTHATYSKSNHNCTQFSPYGLSIHLPSPDMFNCICGCVGMPRAHILMWLPTTAPCLHSRSSASVLCARIHSHSC